VTRTAVTGANGFLGWHTRGALRERGDETIPIAVGDRAAPDQMAAALQGVDDVIHIAGVNRGPDEDVRDGNAQFAAQVAETIERLEAPPRRIVFANSTQAANGTPYGDAKAAAAERLAGAAAAVGALFVDAKLPNLFGEHGRPNYNAVTSTFCQMLAEGGEPEVIIDREMRLMHAQVAADVLIGSSSESDGWATTESTSVSALLARLRSLADQYRLGRIPDVSSVFERDLFNTYRSYLVPHASVIQLEPRNDDRGSFVELVRSAGGTAQTSFSTTRSGVTRGQHFHRRKIERFVVVSGRARISLRRLFHSDVITFDVDGDNPVAIDMPTLWAHNIENVGSDTLYTAFWTDDVFDPARPDTIPENV
jgi:UDP-2-acetamido-2,6-beta-L-arabino-hexul-4-ose reductase